MCQLLALLPAAPCCLHGPGRSSVKSLTYGSHCHRLLVHGAAARNISAQRFGLSRLTAAPGMANLLPVGSTASFISGEAASVASSPSLGSKGFFCRHTPNGSLCKFCKRPDTTENPLLFKRGDQPFLPWRREFGQECNICSYAILDSSEFKAMTTSALIELVGTPEGHERYVNACVIPYEEKKNASNGKRVQSSPVAKTSTQVTASAYAGLKYEKQLGVLWPVAIYKLPEHEGKIPPRRAIQTHVINGQKVRGVLRDPKLGCPLGCYSITGLAMTGAEKSSTVADSKDDIDNETEEMFERAQKRSRVTAKASTARDADGQEVSMTRLAGATYVQNDDSSDEDALLNSIWGSRVVADDGSDEAGGEGNSKKRRSKPPGEPANRKMPKATPGAPAKAGAFAPGSASKKFHQELDLGEQVCLIAEQMLKNLKDPMAYLSIARKFFESTKNKLTGRLTCELVKSYSTERNGTENTRGLQLLDKLRELQKKVAAAEDAVHCLHATEGEQATGEALLASLKKASDGGVDIARNAYEVVTMRAFRNSMDQNKFNECRRLLMVEAVGDEEPHPLGLTHLTGKDAAQVQKAIVSKGVCDLALAEDHPHNVTRLREFVTAMAGASFLTEAMQSEVDRFHSVVTAPDSTDDEDLIKRKKQYDELIADRRGLFSKPATLFPCGMRAMSDAAMAFEQAVADKGLELVLSTACKLADALEVSKVKGHGAFKADGVLHLPQKPEYQTLLKHQAHILANSSKRFQQQSSEELGKIASLQEVYMTHCLRACQDMCEATVVNAMASIAEVLSAEGVDPPPPGWRIANEQQFQVAVTFLDQIDRSKLTAVLPNGLVQRFFDGLEVHRALVKSLQQALGWIGGVRAGVGSPLASELAPLLLWLTENPLSDEKTKKMISQKIREQLVDIKQRTTAQAKAFNTT